MTIRPRTSLFATLALLLAAAGCSRSPEQRELAYLSRARQFVAAKDWQRAQLEFLNAAHIAPKDFVPHYELGMMLMGIQSHREAEVAFNKALTLNPGHVPSRLRAAELMASGNRERVLQAEKNVAELLRDRTNDADALSTLAAIEVRLGKLDSAEQHLQAAVTAAPSDLKVALRLMDLKLGRRNLEGATQVLRRATERLPKSAEAALALSRLFQMKGDLAGAHAELERALKIDPRYGPALLDTAFLQRREGKLDLAEQTYRRLSQLPEPEYQPLHAMFVMQTGHVDAAIAELESLAKKNPADRAMRTKLVTAYQIAKRDQDTFRLLNEALRKNGKDVEALFQRGTIYLNQNRFAEAQRDLAECLRLRKDLPGPHYAMAKVHRALGKRPQELQELGEALDRDRNLLPARIELAQNFIDANSVASGLKLLESAPPEQKQAVEWMVLRNLALMKTERWADARRGIDAGLARARRPELLVEDADLRVALKDYRGALVSLEEVLRQNPDNMLALKSLMHVYAVQNQFAEGIARLREFAAQRPNSAGPHQFAAQMLQYTKRGAEARAELILAKAADSADLSIDLDIATLNLNEGKLAEAHSGLSQVLARDPKNGAAHDYMADLDARTGNFDAAIQERRRSIEIEPQNARYLNDLAYLLGEHGGALDEALRLAQQAIDLAPHEPRYQDTLGWIYYHQGMFTAARTILERCAARPSASAEEKRHLGMAYLQTGDAKRGREILQRAVLLDPELLLH